MTDMSSFCPDCGLFDCRTKKATDELAAAQSKLEALTQAAVGALGYLPVNVPGARMAKERIEAVLAEIGVAVAPCAHGSFGACMTCDLKDVAQTFACPAKETASEPRAIVESCLACERHKDGFDEPCWVHGAGGAAREGP